MTPRIKAELIRAPVCPSALRPPEGPRPPPRPGGEGDGGEGGQGCGERSPGGCSALAASSPLPPGSALAPLLPEPLGTHRAGRRGLGWAAAAAAASGGCRGGLDRGSTSEGMAGCWSFGSWADRRGELGVKIREEGGSVLVTWGGKEPGQSKTCACFSSAEAVVSAVQLQAPAAPGCWVLPSCPSGTGCINGEGARGGRSPPLRNKRALPLSAAASRGANWPRLWSEEL